MALTLFFTFLVREIVGEFNRFRHCWRIVAWSSFGLFITLLSNTIKGLKDINGSGFFFFKELQMNAHDFIK